MALEEEWGVVMLNGVEREVECGPCVCGVEPTVVDATGFV